MRIVFDGRWMGRTGIGRYADELLDQLQRLDQSNEYLVLLLPKYFETWTPAAPNFNKVLTSHEVYTWQEQVLLPRQIKALKPDLVHFTSFNLPLSYHGDFVTTVHDLTLINFKNVRGSGLKKALYEAKYQVMKQVLAASVGRAQAVITPTEYVRDGLSERFPAATKKMHVTWEAVSPDFAAPADISRFKLPDEYLLYVGNYYPYKNVERLVRAFVRTDAYGRGVSLVLNGKADYFQDRIRDVAKELDTRGLIVFPGYTSDSELAGLYRGAKLFVLPSLSEGFGLPGLEAMTQSLPVLASRESCFPEVYADAASYFDGYDIADMAEKIDILLANPAEMDALKVAGLERVKQFSWETMARQTIGIYEASKRS